MDCCPGGESFADHHGRARLADPGAAARHLAARKEPLGPVRLDDLQALDDPLGVQDRHQQTIPLNAAAVRLDGLVCQVRMILGWLGFTPAPLSLFGGFLVRGLVGVVGFLAGPGCLLAKLLDVGAAGRRAVVALLPGP